MNSAAAFGIGAAGVIATSLGGSYYTSKTVRSDWYDCIRPVIAPPRIVFPIVWTTLYIVLAIAIGISLRDADSTTVALLHGLNLLLNVYWCKLYFADKRVVAAFVVLLVNLAAAVAIAFLTRSRVVGYLFIPYIAWLAFASVLNGASMWADAPI